MPIVYTSFPGRVVWSWTAKHPQGGPREGGQSVAPILSAFRDFPSPESRKRPTGDAFDTATARITRSSAVTYTTCIDSDHSDPDYSLVTTAPTSWFYASPLLVSSAESSFNWPDGSAGPATCFPDLGLRARLGIKNQKVNLLQALGERKQTATLVQDLAVDLVRVGKSLVRTGGASALGHAVQDVLGTRLRGRDSAAAKKARFRKGSKRAAQRWLQMQYGILPAMSDIYGSAEAVAAGAQRGLYHYSRHSKTTQGSYSVTAGKYQGLTTVKTTSRMAVRWKYGSSPLVELSSLGLTNPAVLVWELTPWSFVADWVLNMGKFLSGLDALVGVPSIAITQSFRRTSEVTGTYAGSVANGHIRGQAIVTRRYGVSHNLPYGSPTFVNPMATNGVIRSLNALALMRGQIRL